MPCRPLIPIQMLALLLFLPACTVEAPVAATAAPATNVVPARRAAYPVSYAIAPELETLRRDARGGPCTYPISIGAALVQSLETVNAKAFPAGAVRIAADAPLPGLERHIAISLDSFSPDVVLEPGWWSVGAVGRVDLALRVTVQDAAGSLLWTGLVTGNGQAEGASAGGCGEGGRMLSLAGNEAVRKVVEDYVTTVINSGQI